MKHALLKAVTFTIVIGILAMAINTAFGYETIVYLQKEQINMVNNDHFFIWKIDFWQYISNIQLTTSNLSILEFKLPTRTWNTDIANNFALVVDYLIVQINVLLYPLKIGAYLIQNVMAIMGINNDITATHNGLKWLVQFVRDILSNIAVPYI